MKTEVFDLSKITPPTRAYLSVSENELAYKPGVYLEGFEYSTCLFKDLHRVTAQYGYTNANFKGGYRDSGNVQGFGNLIIFDIDEFYTIDEVRALLDGVEYLIVTTSNHQKEKHGKPPCDRFRVIMPADKVLNASTPGHFYKRLMETVALLLGFDTAKLDSQCFDPARFFKPNRGEQLQWYGEGQVLNMATAVQLTNERIRQESEERKLAAAQRAARRVEFKETTDQDISDALDAIPPQIGYDEWLRVGMAIKAHYGDGGFMLWDGWSAGASNYPGERALEKKWASFKKSGVGIATLFHIAKGYK